MTFTTTQLVLAVWSVAAITAVVSFSYALYRAFHDGPGHGLQWRRAKILASSLGVITILLALAAFERSIREFDESAISYLNDEYLDLKFYTTEQRAEACAKDQSTREAQNECFDFSNLDNQVDSSRIWNRKPFLPPTNWQHNPHLDREIDEIKRRFANMNSAMAIVGTPILSYETRIKLGILALITAIISLATGIGEATYQYLQDKARSATSP